MLAPDNELALEILDALDDRRGTSAGPFGYELVRARERAWLEQKCRMIDGLQAWLERQRDQARHDVPLQQAISTLCGRLALTREAYLQDLVEMDAALERAWRTSQPGVSRIPVITPFETGKGRR